MVPPRRSFGSVRSRSGGASLVPPAHARVAAQGTQHEAFACARSGHGLGNETVAHRPSVELRTCGKCHSPAHGATRALFLVQCGFVVVVRLSCLQRTLASLLKAREMGVRLRSLGLWLRQRAWGPPPVCRAQDVRRMPFTSAWCHPRALFGLVRFRRGGAPLVPPAHARVAAQGTRDWRALALARSVAWATGLGPTARLPSSGRAVNAIHQRMVPPARSFSAVRSRSGGASLVPPAHARVAAQGTRDWRALALARAVAWATGLRPTARVPSSGRAVNAIHQRMVPPARSFGAVRSRSSGAPLVPRAHARVAAQGTRDVRVLALARPVA